MLPIKIKLDDSFFEEEDRNGYVVSAENKKMWAVELDLLVEFDRVCRENNLRYYLDGGTLLGALRHKGFIPWDDDVDVSMLREDYDKLISIADTAFSHPYFLQTAYNDKGYGRTHCQLRNVETCGALINEADVVLFNQGMFLDIFVQDGVPENDEDYKTFHKQLRKMYTRFNRITKPVNVGNTFKYILKLIRRWVFVNFGLLRKEYRKFEELSRKYIDSEDVFLASFYSKWEDLRRFKKSWFETTVDMEFEGFKFKCPCGYDEVLKGYYGPDYMTPQQAPNGHGTMIIDTEKSYKKVLRERKKSGNT